MWSFNLQRGLLWVREEKCCCLPTKKKYGRHYLYIHTIISCGSNFHTTCKATATSQQYSSEICWKYPWWILLLINSFYPCIDKSHPCWSNARCTLSVLGPIESQLVCCRVAKALQVHLRFTLSLLRWRGEESCRKVLFVIISQGAGKSVQALT